MLEKFHFIQNKYITKIYIIKLSTLLKLLVLKKFYYENWF